MTVIEQERVSAPPKEREDAREERERRASVLEAAALEIEVRGHTKGQLCDEKGAVCAMGAIACANGWAAARWDYPWPEFLKAETKELDYWLKVVDFNNAPERTPDEVTFFLRWRAEEIRDGR